MNKEAKGQEIQLRRSTRNRKGAVSKTVDGSGSSTEGESETETVVGWKIGSEIVEDEKVSRQGESNQGGSEYSFGTFSETAYENYGFEDEKERVERRPRVVREQTTILEDVRGERMMSKDSTDSGKGRTPEPGLGDFMRMYIDDQRAERDERRREREDNRAREERLYRSLAETRTTPDPEQTPKPILSLPVIRDSEEITEFLPKFEAALQWRKVPRDQWRDLLVSHMPIDLLMKIRSQVDDEDGSYEDLVGALSNSSTLTFCAAAEDLCTGERGRVWEMEGRKAAARVKSLLGQVTRYADTKPDLIDCITGALVRDRLVPSLKGYVDSARRFELEEFLSTCEEW